MSILHQINDLADRRNRIHQGGGEEAVLTQHTSGKLTARERISLLLDADSFVEIGAFTRARSTDFNMQSADTPADGVITGYGAIEGRLAYVYSQDATVLGGSLGEIHAKKIAALYDLALKMGAPVIALLDSAGLRLQEGTDALEGYGTLFYKQSQASGVIPQLTAVLGSCGGGAAIIPSLSDFILMTKENSSLYVNSPNTLTEEGENQKNLAKADYHAEVTGIADFICDNDEECLLLIRKLCLFMPLNYLDEGPHVLSEDSPEREEEGIAAYMTDGTDALGLLTAISDKGSILAIKEAYGKEVVTAFIRMNGMTIGAIANHTKGSDGRLTLKGLDKITRFVKLCDAFNLPILTLTDITGFEASQAAEKAGLSRAAAAMVHAFAQSTVPRVNVIVNRAYGSAYTTFNSKSTGADMVYAWPNAKVAVMEAAMAVKIMYAEEIKEGKMDAEGLQHQIAAYAEHGASPYAAASRGYIDDIINPSATRKRVIAAFEMLYTKRVISQDKKHPTL